MAPQNSTLLHETYADATSELSRYSPILPPNEHGNDVQEKKSITSHATAACQDEEIPIWILGEPRYISGITNSTTCNDIIKALITDEINNCGVFAPAADFATTTTTAITADDAKAVVSHDFYDYIITEKWRDIEQALAGETCVLPLWLAWGVARDEVKFKLKINRNRVDSHTTKDTFEIQQPLTKIKKHKTKRVNMITKLIRKITKQGEVIQEYVSSISENTIQSRPKIFKSSRRNKNFATQFQNTEIRTITTIPDSTEDELFLAIEQSEGDRDSGIHVTQKYPSSPESSMAFLNQNFGKAPSKRFRNILAPIINTPKRKRKYKPRTDIFNVQPSSSEDYESSSLDYTSMLPNYVQKIPLNTVRNATEYIVNPKSFDKLRSEIMANTLEIKQLVEQKDYLTNHLLTKNYKYKAFNNFYKTKIGLQFCIEEVQTKIELYAQEIIRSEMELYKIKTEIKEKGYTLNNLMRMLRSEIENIDQENIPKLNTISSCQNSKIPLNNNIKNNNFVEFFENNESFIV